MSDRSRDLLHFNHLEEFKTYCKGYGWMEQPTKGYYERLRMKNPHRASCLIVYVKADAKEHFTTYGEAQRMTMSFLSAKRKLEGKREPDSKRKEANRVRLLEQEGVRKVRGVWTERKENAQPKVESDPKARTTEGAPRA